MKKDNKLVEEIIKRIKNSDSDVSNIVGGYSIILDKKMSIVLIHIKKEYSLSLTDMEDMKNILRVDCDQTYHKEIQKILKEKFDAIKIERETKSKNIIYSFFGLK